MNCTSWKEEEIYIDINIFMYVFSKYTSIILFRYIIIVSLNHEYIEGKSGYFFLPILALTLKTLVKYITTTNN